MKTPNPVQKKQLLLKRLDEIAASVAARPSALALIGFGSTGLELDRLDRYSDLDFFVIVEPGAKPAFLEGLDWLSEIGPVAYAFKNTEDGYKLLYEDGVFCEFAVFEEAELAAIPFSPGRIVWKRDSVAASIAIPARDPVRPEKSEEFLLGEALTNLYVGVARDLRGEKLTAMRFIQGYAVDRILDLTELHRAVPVGSRDAFGLERRFEQRHPEAAARLPDFLQGYARNRESALAILDYLESNFEVNRMMVGEIRRLLD